MKKSIKTKAEKLNTMFITENPINFSDKYIGCKYFIVFNNTHKIVGGFKTQKELEKRIDEILVDGAHDGSSIFY